MKFHHFCPPNENPWLHQGNYIIAPLVHNVSLIMDNCWTTDILSGSTKLCNRLRKHFRWFALKYFFGLDIKSLIDLKFLVQLKELEPPLPPLLAMRLCLAFRVHVASDLVETSVATSHALTSVWCLQRNFWCLTFWRQIWCWLGYCFCLPYFLTF